jgi:hypothetical protein
VDSDPGDLVPVEFHLAGVQADADPDAKWCYRCHCCRGRPHRWGWGVEPGQKPVAGGVDLAATMGCYQGSDHILVADQQGSPGRIPKAT